MSKLETRKLDSCEYHWELMLIYCQHLNVEYAVLIHNNNNNSELTLISYSPDVFSLRIRTPPCTWHIRHSLDDLTLGGDPEK